MSLIRPKKSPLWKFFTISAANEKYVLCNLCNAKVSRGSEDPRKQGTGALKNHLKVHHNAEFKTMEADEKGVSDADPSTGVSGLGVKRKSDSSTVPIFSMKTKKDRLELTTRTIPGWIDSTKNMMSTLQKLVNFIALSLRLWS